MTGSLIVLGAIIAFVLVVVSKGIRIVQQAQVMVVERLGKFHATLQSGVNFILPILDKPREIDWRFSLALPNGDIAVRRYKTIRIDLREAVYDFPRQSVITKDNVVTEINALIYYQVTDPVRAVYEIANLPDAIEKLTQTTLRNVIGEMDLDETLASRDTINAKLRAILDEATNKWGVKVNRVELQDISPPRDIKDAMEKQMRAERERRATIITAEADKQSRILEAEGIKAAAINKAEGDKQARILGAEAEAEARLKVAQAEANAIATISESIGRSGGDPAQYLIAIRYIEALKEMVSGQNNKVVYLPYEATGVLGSLGGIRELLAGPGGPGARPPQTK
jgi:regulator of protease activity HflC (stomatin/prohibitin superfamily)